MRTPVILVAGQKDTDPVVGALLRTPGTVVVEHRFDGPRGAPDDGDPATWSVDDRGDGLELAHGCVSCTIRNDLLVLLRQLHRRDDIDVTLLRRSGRANHPALVEQILADVFALLGVTDRNDGYGRTFLSRFPLAQRVS